MFALWILGALHSSSAPADSDLERLRYLLEARDAAIATLCLDYEATQSPWDGCTWVERGEWILARENRACVAIRGCQEFAPELLWSYWTGVETYLAGEPSTWDEVGRLDLTNGPAFDSFDVTRRPSAGALSPAYLPDELGLGVANVLWGDYIAVFSDLRVLGRETVGEVDCLAVLMDMDGRRNDGIYTFPWIVHFDDQRTMLALRVAPLRRAATATTGTQGSRESEGGPSTRRYIDGSWWEHRSLTEVSSWEEIAPGLWIGTQGTVSYFASDRVITTSITVTPGSPRLNFPIPDWMEAGFGPTEASARRVHR